MGSTKLTGAGVFVGVMLGVAEMVGVKVCVGVGVGVSVSGSVGRGVMVMVAVAVGVSDGGGVTGVKGLRITKNKKARRTMIAPIEKNGFLVTTGGVSCKTFLTL